MPGASVVPAASTACAQRWPPQAGALIENGTSPQKRGPRTVRALEIGPSRIVAQGFFGRQTQQFDLADAEVDGRNFRWRDLRGRLEDRYELLSEDQVGSNCADGARPGTGKMQFRLLMAELTAGRRFLTPSRHALPSIASG
jgi:hypothetical protein